MSTSSGYVKWLRSRVGHQKIILVRACGIVTDQQGRVLLQRHPNFGWWGLPGSLLEPGDRLSACLVRNLRQQTGLVVEPTRLIGLHLTRFAMAWLEKRPPSSSKSWLYLRVLGFQ